MPERLMILIDHFQLSHGGLASLIGVNRSQVSHWLSGRSAMPQATAMAIQAATGVRWQWLLCLDDQMLLDDMGVLSAEEVPLLTNIELLQRHNLI